MRIADSSEYATNMGVSKDEIKANEWFKKAFESNQKAADQGDADAQYHLSNAYSRGDGIQKNDAKAVEWLMKAANQGHIAAQYSIADCYYESSLCSYRLIDKVGADPLEKKIQSIEKAIDWYQKAANQGSVHALRTLADIYLQGKDDSKDEKKGFEYVEKLAVLGASDGQFKLGNMYAKGTGVPKNEVQAFEWFEKAAAQGHLLAQFNLGYIYSEGKGVTQDMARSYAWYNLVSAKTKDFVLYLDAEGMGPDKTIDKEELPQKRRDEIEVKLSAAQLTEGQRLASNWKKGDTFFKEVGNNPTINQTSSIAAATTLKKQYYGTAFMVSENGLALTNAHVVNDCKEVRISDQSDNVKVITHDGVNDLALLQLPSAPYESATLNAEPTKLRQGEDIVVFGFPLNYVLSSGGNLTPGTVSALSGLGNNSTQIQITAPIQPGSSGSPVLDKKGNVIGIAMMMLDDLKSVRTTGSVPQNVNFAINGQTIQSFLDTNNVHYKTGGGFFSMEKNNADIADAARKWT